MKVLMFGWEFPPFNSGGLGTACYGLTKALSNNQVEVTFVVPRAPDTSKSQFVRLISAADLSNVNIKEIDSPLVGYMSSEEYEKEMLLFGKSGDRQNLYGKNLFAEVHRYARKAALIAKNTEHDVIHAHDWMTYQAGIAAKQVSGKPLIVHMHATEFDRTGGNGVHQYVYDIEREGMHAADAVIAVSNFTKDKVVDHYGVDPTKVRVVHNGVEFERHNFREDELGLAEEKVVLFLGRITLQKGPDYYLYAAKKVLEHDPNITFVMAGSGDMQARLMHKAADLGIADKVLFTGFLRGKDVDRAFQMADVYVMPSVSEPFGISPLEAIKNDTPVIISKQSGISEVLQNCLKVDFWDVHELANSILAVLEYTELDQSLRENSSLEMGKFDWNIPAQKCIEVYNAVLG